VEKVNISAAVKSSKVEEHLTKGEKTLVWLTFLGITLFFYGLRKYEQKLVKEIEIIKKRNADILNCNIITRDEYYETFKSNFEPRERPTQR